MLQNVAKYLKARMSVVAMFVMALAFGFVQGAHATDAGATVTIPDVPINFGTLAESASTTVGTLLAAVAGLVIVIALTIAGLKWVKGAVSGRAPR